MQIKMYIFTDFCSTLAQHQKTTAVLSFPSPKSVTRCKHFEDENNILFQDFILKISPRSRADKYLAGLSAR